MSDFTRRHSLALLAGAASSSMASVSFAQGLNSDFKGRKFIFVILRGAMDGLSALIPDDKEIEDLRGHILPKLDTRLNLGNGFRLHPSFAGLQGLYNDGQAAFIHACATPYRARSHFEGQDALETLSGAGGKKGWLNRALLDLSARHGGKTGLAIGRTVPLALKGDAPVTSWSPPIFPMQADDVLTRLSDLYQGDDVFAPSLAMAQDRGAVDVKVSRRESRKFSRGIVVTLSAAGRLMSAKGGPNIGMVGLDGWDTHDKQQSKLTNKFADLDEGLLALKNSLGASWEKTCVVVCSEFGRTVAANGTRGTDHGTGGLAILLGGAVKGRRV